MSKASVYDVVTEKITAALEAGTVPWQKLWSSSGPNRNLTSGRPYSGVNSLLLALVQLEKGYSSPYWLTFKQCKKLGGFVRKGEKSAMVTFWKQIEVEDKDTGEKREQWFAAYYNVFNVEQCEGIDKHVPVNQVSEFNPIEAAEKMLAAWSDIPAMQHGGDRAAYSPLLDVVKMPKPETFVSSEAYYSVLFHELTHSTGAAKRLSREGVTNFDTFGSEQYSREELIAEIGAAMLCAAVGIEPLYENSAAYLRSWLEALNNDKRLIMSAASKAQKAADYILSGGAAAAAGSVPAAA